MLFFYDTAKESYLVQLPGRHFLFQVEALAVSPDSTLLATGGVDRNLCLSAIEVKDTALKNLELDMNKLPYANLPVSNQNLPTVTVTGMSMLSVLQIQFI